MIELRSARIVSAAVPRRDHQRRQDEVVQMAQEAVAVARHRKDRHGDREQQHEQQAEPERRHRHRGDEDQLDRLVGPSAAPHRREQRQRHRQRDRDQRAQADQRQRRPEPVEHLGADRAPRGDRQAEAARRDVAEKADVLLQERPVEAELARQRGDVLGVAARAQHQRGRIARHDAQQQERHRRDADQHRDQLQQPAQQEPDELQRRAAFERRLSGSRRRAGRSSRSASA